jgi:hypothetical protein
VKIPGGRREHWLRRPLELVSRHRVRIREEDVKLNSNCAWIGMI